MNRRGFLTLLGLSSAAAAVGLNEVAKRAPTLIAGHPYAFRTGAAVRLSARNVYPDPDVQRSLAFHAKVKQHLHMLQAGVNASTGAAP